MRQIFMRFSAIFSLYENIFIFYHIFKLTILFILFSLEMISKMEKGDIELNQKIQQELARIRLDITEQKMAGGDDLVSHVISSLTPTLASYVKSWF